MFDKESVLKALTEHKRAGKQIVFTNGCFDILHIGHARYLADAKAQGDILVVGVNSDESVKRLEKGPLRPIVPEAERAELLLSLKAVDYTVIFIEDTPYNLIKDIQPNILVKGGDWPIDKIVGADIVTASGGKVLSLPFVKGKSTTNIVTKIQASLQNS